MEQDFEEFSVYGFSIRYPKDSRLEFNPKSRRNQGDVVFHFPDKMKIFLSWGDLEKASKNFPTVEEHADHSMEKIKSTRNVTGFERISHDSVDVNSHQGSYNRARFEEVIAGFLGGKNKSPREAYSLHVHCQDSSRFFVVYALLPVGGVSDHERVFAKMARSLKCH